MKAKILIMFVFIMFTANKSNAFDKYLNINSIYLPDNMTMGIGIGLGNMFNDDEFILKTYPITKRSMYKYLGQDAGYFHSGQSYVLTYEKRISPNNSDNLYYCYGYDVGGINFIGKYFNEFHPILLGRMGLGVRYQVLRGEIYIENVVSIGIITYMTSIIDIFYKFRPDITYEFPVYFGYKIYI